MAEALPVRREPVEMVLPTSYNVASQQVNAAQEAICANTTDAPRVPWRGLVDLVGPALLGEMWVIGARTGCGKTTFLLNWFQHLVERGMPVLYMGTESAAEMLRRRWAAWRLGYPAAAVLENDWSKLPPDAKDRLFVALQEQATDYHDVAFFGDAPDLDPATLGKYLKAAERRGIQVIILDHIHRVRLGGSSGDQTHRLGLATRLLKQWAVRAGAVIIVAAQLNRPERVPMADLSPPPLSALKQSGTLEEEADVALLLHKTRRSDCTPEELRLVLRGERPVTDVLAAGVMAVRVGKHRRRGGIAVEHTAFLQVDERGGLTDRAPEWRALLEEPRREREPGEE